MTPGFFPALLLTERKQVMAQGTYEYIRYMRDGSTKKIVAVVRKKKPERTSTARGKRGGGK